MTTTSYVVVLTHVPEHAAPVADLDNLSLPYGKLVPWRRLRRGAGPRSARGCGRCALERDATLADLAEDDRHLGEHAVPAGVRAAQADARAAAAAGPGPPGAARRARRRPETGDPRVRAKPVVRHGRTFLPLTRRPGGLQAFKMSSRPSEADAARPAQTHEGYEWLYVLSGRVRLLLGDRDLLLAPGEVVEFDTRTPHWFATPGRTRPRCWRSSAPRASGCTCAERPGRPIRADSAGPGGPSAPPRRVRAAHLRRLGVGGRGSSYARSVAGGRERVGVVGAGIVGLAVARRLLEIRPGIEVTVFEKETGVGRHQTGHNSGVVHAGLYYPPGSLKARLCRRGVGAAARVLRRSAGSPYDECGKLVVALDRRGGRRGCGAIEERATANGVPGLRRLDRRRLREHRAARRRRRRPALARTAIVDFARRHPRVRRRRRGAAAGAVLLGHRGRPAIERGTATWCGSTAGGERARASTGSCVCAGLQSDRARAAGRRRRRAARSCRSAASTSRCAPERRRPRARA